MISSLNLPNILTISRIVLTIFFLIFLFLPIKASKLIALIIFSLASFTDFLDGRIARKRNISTRLGAFLDPLADKILISGAFISFVELRLIPAWMVIVILTREFLITGLRLYAVTVGRTIPATMLGKHKTLSQMLAVYLILIYLALDEYGLIGAFRFHFKAGILILMYITVCLTLVSGISYVYNNREVFKRS